MRASRWRKRWNCSPLTPSCLMPPYSAALFTWPLPMRSQAISKLLPFLEQHSIQVSRMERIRPTLEDVFVSLTGRSRLDRMEARP